MKEEQINSEEKLKIYKDEKKGIWTLMILYFLSWGLIITHWGIMRLIGWIVLGLIGFALWKIFDNLFTRTKRKDENKRKGRSKE